MIIESVKSLETLQKLLELKDENTISAMVHSLKHSDQAEPLSFILKAVENQRYEDANILIDDFIRQSRQVAISYDPIVSALKVELYFQEGELNLLRSERDDLAKTIEHFRAKFHTHLGSLIERVLYLRKEKLRIQSLNNAEMKETYEAALKEYEAYYELLETSTKGIIYRLDDEKLKELKKLYRKAALICHPDRVTEEQKEQAQEMFEELHEAYLMNDIRKVKLITELLEKTGQFDFTFDKYDDAAILKIQIEKVLLSEKEIQDEIREIKSSDTYETIDAINEDWKDYFSRIGENYKAQISELENWMSLHSSLN